MRSHNNETNTNEERLVRFMIHENLKWEKIDWMNSSLNAYRQSNQSLTLTYTQDQALLDSMATAGFFSSSIIRKHFLIALPLDRLCAVYLLTV